MAVGLSEFQRLAQSCGSRKEFVKRAQKKYPQLSSSYIGQVWYKVRQSNNNSKVRTPEPAQQNTEDTEDDNSSNVENVEDKGVETPEVSVVKGENTESVGLKDIYGRMFDEESNDSDENSYDEDESEDDSGDDNTTRIKVSPARFLVSIAQGINNNLLYGGAKIVGERKLTNDEVDNIIAFSDDVAKKDLKMLEDQPELNYFIASFIVPAINRSDLYINKLKEFIAKHPKKQQQKQSNVENVEAQSAGNDNKSIYSAQQQQTIDQWVRQGFRVDPEYNFTQPIDIIAYRDMHIIRNTGSDYA